MKIRLFLTLASMMGALAGCNSDPRPPLVGDGYDPGAARPTCIDQDGDGYGLHCSLGNDCDDTNVTITNGCYVCAHDAPGCPCAVDQARTACGRVSVVVAGQPTCAYGESVCSQGTWGECVPDGRTVQSVRAPRHPDGLGVAAPCSGNPCDPYCQQFPDTPDDSLTKPPVLAGTDGGLTLTPVEGGALPLLPDGPMPGYVKTAIEDAGLGVDAQAGLIYHELPPPAVAHDTVVATNEVKAIDVYFLENNTGTVSRAESALRDKVPTAGGTIDQVRAVIPDAWFGVGRFGQYDWWPWNDSYDVSVVFEHVLSTTADKTAIQSALAWVRNQHVEAPASPHSFIPALYGLATTGGLPASPGWWVVPRSAWSSGTSGESGACPPGRVGYPCFRRNALPVTVILADAPSENGPGGQYAYARNDHSNAVYDAAAIPGAKLWKSITPTNVTGNGTEATAYTIDPTQFGIYTGSTTTYGIANQYWQGDSDIQCDHGRGASAKNVFFKFHAAKRTWFHFDTVGSSFEAVPYLYQSNATYLACNEWTNFIDSPEFVPSSIDGVVDPGDYFLVVDGIAGAEGNYVLHVNAMPDGAATGPVAEPNYEEAVAAYGALGGKIVGIDGSGYKCDGGYSSFVQRNTANALEKLARDTGSVDAANNPYLLYWNASGGLCHAGDPPLAKQLADAIVGVATSRANITAVAIDTDDAKDFDGPPGGSNNLTPGNIDDATFVTSLTAVSTAETAAKCQQTLADRFIGCLPGTQAKFQVNFKTPASIAALSHPQIFTFVVRVLRDGSTILSETPVVIVVPATTTPLYDPAWFVRDYDTTDVCPRDTEPVWSFWGWNADTPGDSRIDFDVAVAPTAAELATAPVDALRFSQPPGPASLAGQVIGAQKAPNDTQAGATLVDATLSLNMRPRNAKALRMRAHLIPSTDRTHAPTLQAWNLQVSCRPAL